MQLTRTTKKGNSTKVLAVLTPTVWQGKITLTGETSVEYLQVKLTADDLRAMLALIEGK